ncbi:MAG TPA: CvpA family protein [Candidatus Sulfotelmatobacter sp.]|nr:CvpA family protein [Candidatus Sulfotelmatobacter sp.]
MSIWILAIIVLALGGLAGWRQGGVRACIAFVGIFFAWLLAVPFGKIFHFLMPWFGVANPVYQWIFSPVCGFILVTTIFAVIAFNVNRKLDVYYRHQAGQLQLALWERLNVRLGICVGLVNGAAYFALISFFIFNFAYWTTQISANATESPWVTRLMNNLGNELESTGFARTAAAIGTPSAENYKLADFAGFLMQNPDADARLATYPGLTSLWQRDEMQPYVTDATLTNAPAAGASIGDIWSDGNVQDFLKNKDLRARMRGFFDTNGDDLLTYLQTGNTKYDSEKLIGSWRFNANVTLAWLRQNQPQLQPKEIAAVRSLWSAAYGQATLLVTGDNQVFVKSYPLFSTKPRQNQPPYDLEAWTGDWSRDGDTYTLHVTYDTNEKYLTATTTDGLRLSIKEGGRLLIFDRAD